VSSVSAWQPFEGKPPAYESRRGLKREHLRNKRAEKGKERKENRRQGGWSKLEKGGMN
jgi:hypothetical protein